MERDRNKNQLNEFFEEENLWATQGNPHSTTRLTVFCKKVVRNEALNIQKKYARFRQRQISMEILEQKGLGTEFYYSEPNMNSSASFIVLGIMIFIQMRSWQMRFQHYQV